MLLDAAAGAPAGTYGYDAFGTLVSQTGDVDNSILYAGYQYDFETGLYYLNARYYDSTTGRFITEDTYAGRYYDPLSLNRYTYCQNNPVRYTDPSGHVFFTILAGALIGAAVGAGVEIVSQKVIEKKKEVDWKSVGYEAAVGAVGGAIGGVFGKAGSVIGGTKKGVAKMVAKTVVKAGVSEAAGGFLEDAGRQLFVEGKGMKQLDLGRLFRTAGIAGLTGMLGSVFGMLPDLLSDYRMETVTKTVTRVKTVNKCKNNRIDCPNHPNYPVIVDRYQEVVTVPELVYVGKEGAENAAKGAAGRLDDDVAGMVARKESPLDPVKGWFKEKIGNEKEIITNTIDYTKSKETFFDKGRRKATTKQIRKYKKEVNSRGIGVVVDKKSKIIKDEALAGFDYDRGNIYIKKDTGLLELYHEWYHAEQYLSIGRKEYISLGRLNREEYVYRRIMENKILFNERELEFSKGYIIRLRDIFRNLIQDTK